MKVLSEPEEERAFRVCPPNERGRLLDEIILPAIGAESRKKFSDWIRGRGCNPHNTQYFWMVSLLARKVRDEGKEITLESMQGVAERVRRLGAIDSLLIE